MSRRAPTLRLKNNVLRWQATCAYCGVSLVRVGRYHPLWGQTTVDIDPTHYDHTDFHALGGSDTHPRNFAAIHQSCHDRKTNGVKGVPLSGDKSKIAKVKHLQARQKEHADRLDAKASGTAPSPHRKGKKPWPTRPFPKRPKPKTASR